MNTELRKALEYFFSYLLPLFWVLGFVNAMVQSSVYLKSHILLCYSVRVSLIILIVQVAYDMRLREIKGWYEFICAVISLGISGLSMWIYLTFAA